MIITLEMLCTGIIKINIHIIMHKKMLVAAAAADVAAVAADVVVVAADVVSAVSAVQGAAAAAEDALAAGAGGSFNFVT